MLNIKPMLLSVADKAFDGEGWIFEPKWDGFRALAVVETGHSVHLISRNGRDLTSRFPGLAKDFAGLPVGTVLDGEIVAGNGKKGSFSALQQKTSGQGQNSFVVFDVIRTRGKWLLETPLAERRELLQGLGDLLISPAVPREGKRCFEALRDAGYEGMVGKKLDSRYYPGRRTREWLKVKAYEMALGIVESFLLVGGAAEKVAVRGLDEDFYQEVALGRAFLPAGGWESLLGRIAFVRHGDRITLPPVLGARIRYLEKTKGGHLRHATVVGFFPVVPEATTASSRAAGRKGESHGPGTSGDPDHKKS